MIAFEDSLTIAEKRRVYSYLGLKYGITININNQNFDYIFSDGSTAWPGMSSGVHGKYHYNVAAIIRDDLARLHNNIATSTDEDAVLTINLAGWFVLGTQFIGHQYRFVWRRSDRCIDNARQYIENRQHQTADLRTHYPYLSASGI